MRQFSTTAVLSLLTLLFLGGCELLDLPADRSSKVVFATEQRVYAPGDTVMLRLENKTNQLVRYNLCFSTLEQKDGAAWEDADERRPCPAALFGLQPDSVATDRIALPTGLAPATYRYKGTITYQDSPRDSTVVTNLFFVNGS